MELNAAGSWAVTVTVMAFVSFVGIALTALTTGMPQVAWDSLIVIGTVVLFAATVITRGLHRTGDPDSRKNSTAKHRVRPSEPAAAK